MLDHGDEGYGFWLDGAVRDDPVFAEHWAGVRALSVRVEADQIVIRADDRWADPALVMGWVETPRHELDSGAGMAASV